MGTRPSDAGPGAQARDRDGLMALLTNKEVEDGVVRRVQLKATAYGKVGHAGEGAGRPGSARAMESLSREGRTRRDAGGAEAEQRRA